MHHHHRKLAGGAIAAALGFVLCLAPAAAQAPAVPGTDTPSTASPSAAAPEDNAPPAAGPGSPAAPVLGVPAPVGQASLPSVDKSKLPKDLSPWGMFQAADVVVKTVMIGLVIASIVTWTVWLAKSIELALALRRLDGGLRRIADEASLAGAARALGPSRSVIAAQLEAAAGELRLSASLQRAAGIKERVQSHLDRIEAGAGRSMARGTGVLATIGATAPFVGLFGTVWGIMNSFIGISKAQTTNLAVVAPGIAEALLATALGLAAAIPAVIIYNHFTRAIAGYKALVADSSALVMRLVSRDLDRGAPSVPLSRAAE